jgi:putative transcriptional regulator
VNGAGQVPAPFAFVWAHAGCERDFKALPATPNWCRLRRVNDPETSLKGQLLLDSGQLQGSFFQRTVVLVCQHDANGAFGLVLNRSTGNQVGEMVMVDLPESLKSCQLYLGGPVQPTALSYLHSDAFIPDANVIPNLSLGHSLDTLMEIGQSPSANSVIKMFAGYAGWSAGQLEEEMKRDAWVTHPASLELVFETEPQNLWQNVLKRKGGKYRLLAQMPEDLSTN